MPECAFCPNAAKLSGEHIWSAWMGEVFSHIKRFRFRQRDHEGQVIKEWPSPYLDMKAKVVCRSCNNGWMSDLERHHAKPAVEDMILGNKELSISQSRATSIARFAFKTSVIANHMARTQPSFFPPAIRREFAKSLAIPQGVQMWLAGFLPMETQGHLFARWGNQEIDGIGRIEFYVCTFAVGHLVFQVVSGRLHTETRHQWGEINFTPMHNFEHLAVPFWPAIQDGIVWPLPNALLTRDDFNSFGERWDSVNVQAT